MVRSRRNQPAKMPAQVSTGIGPHGPLSLLSESQEIKGALLMRALSLGTQLRITAKGAGMNRRNGSLSSLI